MKTTNIEILSEKSNCSIVQMPGRQFPGVVLQGDSLKILLELSNDIISLTQESVSEELKETASQLNGLLTSYLHNYESVMRDFSKKLPY